MGLYMTKFYLICGFTIFIGQYCFAQSYYAKTSQFQLSVPKLIYNEVFFENKNEVQLTLGLKDVQIHYTRDGTEPTENSTLYLDKIILNESTKVKAKAFHPNYLPSETVSTYLIKMGPVYKIKNISIDRNPSEKYPGLDAQGLIDRKKGTTNFRTTHWMGFAGGNLETVIEFEKVESINKVIVSVLSDQDSWIFTPQAILVYSSKNGVGYDLMNTLNLEPTPKGTASTFEFLEVVFKETFTQFLKIKLVHFESIPDWHPGKGTPPWLFIDEILME